MNRWGPFACVMGSPFLLGFPPIASAQSLTPSSTSLLQSAADAERNKALILRYYDQAWHRNNFAFADSIFAPDYVRHDGSSPVEGPGQAPLQSRIAEEKKRHLSDLRFHYDVIIAEGDIVAIRWTNRAETKGMASLIRALGRQTRPDRVHGSKPVPHPRGSRN
jgi:hypothetical protein